MPDLLWLNGDVLPFADARLGVEDRGFQFADGVYEVVRLYAGRPFTLREHLDRLERSAEGIRLALPISRDALEQEIQAFIPQTGVAEGMLYLQLTRGVAPRNHVFPARSKPTLLFYTRVLPPVPAAGTTDGVKIITVEDERWQRCWVKSIALLPNVLAKNAAVEAGAEEAAFVENGVVTECCATNLFAVVGGTLVTHPVGRKVLPGITRAVLLDLARDLGIGAEERPLPLEQARSADEVFITSTTREISWVGRWDDHTVSTACGPVTLRLHRALQAKVVTDLAQHVTPRTARAV